MMDDQTLELGLRSRPPADPVYRSRVTAMPPTTRPVTADRRRQATSRPRSMSAATQLFLAIVVLVLGAGALGLIAGSGLVNRPAATPPPTPSPLPSLLPVVIPADVPSGVIETSIGPARWVHLRGDPSTIPGPLTPMPGPTGLLWFDGGGRGPVACDDSGELACIARPQLWASADAISERTELSLPVDAATASLIAHDGAWWLLTSGPTTLWRTTDAARWAQIDLSTLVSPGPAELEWEVRLGLPVSSGGTTVVPVTYRALHSGRLFGRPDLGNRAWPDPTAPRTYRVVEELEGGTRDAGEVLIEETDTGLRFSDMEGNTHATLEGVGMEFVDAWSESWVIVEHQVALVDGGALVSAAPRLPGARLSGEFGGPGPTLFGTSAGFRAYSPMPDGTTRTWRSDDGREWVELDPLGGAEGEPQGADMVGVRAGWGRPPTVFALSYGGPVWVSADGETWTRLESDVDPMRVGDGWLRWDTDTGWFASHDGTSWAPVPGLNRVISRWTTRGAGGAGPTGLIGETLFYAIDEEEGTRRRDLWIVEFGSAAE